MRIVIVFLLVALALSAQPTAPGSEGAPEIPEGVRKYLELTPEQTEALARLNESLARFRSDKLMRSIEVSQEIEQYRLAETLDPMALGLRYVELEAIRREMEAEQKKTVSEAQKLLTPAQRTRVAALEEVLNTHDTACQALSQNLFGWSSEAWWPCPSSVLSTPVGFNLGPATLRPGSGINSRTR